MAAKIFSVIISFIMMVSGFQGNMLLEIRDAVMGAFLGIPSSLSEVSDEFIDKLTDDDVRVIGSSNGYYKNMLAVFIDESASVSDKYRLLAKNGAALLGWYCEANLYFVSCIAPDYSELLSKSDRFEESELVQYAGPITAKKNSEQHTPNDPFESEISAWNELRPSGDNWWLEAIYARQAWDYSEYFNHIDIGIVDSGFDTQHEDLADKIVFPSERDEKRNIASDHGTHVAGIIGAIHNNNLGIAGICDNSTLICADWQADESQMWISDLHILFGLCSTVKAGAKVINYSLGCSGNIPAEQSSDFDFAMRLDAALYSATMSVLLGRGYDFVCVQSAGNGNDDGHAVDSYYNGTFCPINESTAVSAAFGVSKQDILDRIIVVASASNRYNGEFSLSSYSNVGNTVSVAAPGSSVYSCNYGESTYCYKSGTSMAAPVVTAVAALAWSVNDKLSGADIKRIVCAVENTSAVATPYSNPYFENIEYVDYPMINAKLSVEAVLCATYSMGRVEGRICNRFGNPLSSGTVQISRNGETEEYTALSNGTFSFVTKTGDATITVLDDSQNVIAQQSITVIENETLTLGDFLAPPVILEDIA